VQGTGVEMVRDLLEAASKYDQTQMMEDCQVALARSLQVTPPPPRLSQGGSRNGEMQSVAKHRAHRCSCTKRPD